MTSALDSVPATSAPPQADEALNLSWGWCLAWVAVSALEPVLYAVGWTAAGKTVQPTRPDAGLLSNALILLTVLAVPAPGILYWIVVRKLAPRLRWWALASALLAAGFVGLALALKSFEPQAPRMAGTLWALRQEFDWREFAALPWGAWMARSAAFTGAVLLIPAWVFARATRLSWLVPLAAVMVASAVSSLAAHAWQLYGFDFDKYLETSALNGWDWQQRASAMWLQAGRGALWGTTAIFLLALLAAPGAAARRQHTVLAGLAALLLIATPMGGVLLAPNGAIQSWTWLRHGFSRAPAQDAAQGEPLLRYVRTAEPTLRQQPWQASFSPDARTLVAVDSQRRVVRIDVATGAATVLTSEPLEQFETPAWAWSPDGRWLALRTFGDAVRVGNYTRHQAAVRLYSVPGFRLAGEYRHQGAPCFETSPTPLVFEPGSQAVWVSCAQETSPGPDSLLALRLTVAPFAVALQRTYGDLAPWRLGGLAPVGSSLWSWHGGLGQSERIRLLDLSNGREPVQLAQAAMAKPGEALTLQEVTLDDATVTLRYAAWRQRKMHWFVFDGRSGQLLREREAPDGGSGAFYQSILDTTGGLRIQSRWQPEAKAGELAVLDPASGRQRQLVRSVAQRAVAVSGDGRWLATQTLDGARLRLYRIGD